MPRYILRDGKVVASDLPVTIDGTQYIQGVGSLTESERQSLGVTEVNEQPPPEVEFGYVSEDPENPGSWCVTPYTPEQVRSALIDTARQCRWERETGGIEVAGAPVATDDRSKLLLMAAKLLADADPTYTTPWANPDGSTVILDAQRLQALSTAVSAHVDQCFKTFAAVVEQINAGQITTKAQVRAAFQGPNDRIES